MIEPTGYTALDLVGFTDRGTYAANVNYVKNDLVHYGGSIWRILIDDTIGITPAEGPNYALYIGEPTNLVERIIAPLEDNPATVAYQTGRQIIYNDYLYEVIQDIAIGDVLIAYEDDPTNANIKLSSPVETQVLALDGRLDTAEADIVALETGKADNSVIAPVESRTTASRAYAKGAHFIRDSAFCTAKTAIAQGETFTLNTNYTVGTVGNSIKALEESPQISYVTNIINAVDRSSSITDVTSDLFFIPKLRIGIVTISFRVTSAIGSSGACLGNWVSDYLPVSNRPIVPIINNNDGKVDGSLYANNNPNGNTKLMVYAVTSATVHYVQFPMFL